MRKSTLIELGGIAMRNKWPIILVIYVLGLLLSGCSENAVASESQMIEDLQNSTSFYSIQPIDISDVEVTKRQTDEENKVDKVWVQVDIGNSDIEGSLYYLMTYGLYNDGWKLDDIQEDRINEWNFCPLQGPTEEFINSFIPTGATISEESLDLEHGVLDIIYTYTEAFEYCTVEYEKSAYFVFTSNSTGEWFFGGDSEIDRKEHWNIDGHWYYEDIRDTGEERLELYIENFDPSKADTVDGSFSVNSWSKYMLPSTWDDESTNGPFSIEYLTNQYLIHTTAETSLFSKEYIVNVSYDDIFVFIKEGSGRYELQRIVE